MAGPWEQYAAPAADGPWAKYGQPEAGQGTATQNAAAGVIRGAGSIGATITDVARRNAGPVLDAVPANMRPEVTADLRNAPTGAEMRSGMDAGLRELGADPNSGWFAGGKIGGEIAGSLGAGNALAAALSRAAPALSQAIASGGFSGGGGTGAMNWLTRLIGGGANGAATAGIVDPQQAGAGAAIGAALPVVAKVAGAAGNAISQKMEGGANRLMQSAIKPTIKQLQTGDAQTAVETLLERGISPNQAGVNKLRALIEDIDNQISTQIGNSTATVDKQNVLARMADTRQQFANQVSPTADLKAIQAVGDDFLSHPQFPLPQTSMPVQAAQDMKRGTYGVLAKKYGQMGGAETEAQKALARGLKEEVAAAVPAVGPLNAELSRLITTLDVSERRALMELNKNPVGLTALANNPLAAAGFLADRSAAFKAIAARMLNASTPAPGVAGQKLIGAAGNPLVRNAMVRAPAVANEANP